MSNEIIVTAPSGTYVGTGAGGDVTAFLNIPFARAGRWLPPEPVPPGEGVTNTRAYGTAPVQPAPDPFFAKRNGDFTDVPTGEDCLNLNIWLGDLETPKKAVMLWVYGGSYIMGYNYKRYTLPEPFVRAHPEVMVVAPNYRVGVLGSLNLSAVDPEGRYRYSNNLALLDIIAALEWTAENIAAFGGDPDNVTLYGHSAGSNAISHLLAVDRARPLFQRAICQSSFMPDMGTVALDTSREIGVKFLELAGAETLDRALALTPEALLRAQGELFKFRYGGRASKLFSPVEDGLVVQPDAFARIARGDTGVRALMVGTSEGEYDQMFLDKSETESRRFVIERNGDKGVSAADVDAFSALHPEMTEKEIYMTIHNHLGLRMGGELIARALAPRIPVYQFCFDLREPGEGWRAAHGAPCYYVFGTLVPEGAPPGLEAQMMDAWAAFCTGGDPNHPGVPPWPRYTPDGPVMLIGDRWRVDGSYWAADFGFWGGRFRESALLP